MENKDFNLNLFYEEENNNESQVAFWIFLVVILQLRFRSLLPQTLPNMAVELASL